MRKQIGDFTGGVILEWGDVARARADSSARRSSPLRPFRSRSQQHGMHSTEAHVFYASFVRVPRQNHTCPTPIRTCPAPKPYVSRPVRTCPRSRPCVSHPNSHFVRKLPNVSHTGRLPTAPAVIDIEGSCRPNTAHPKFDVRAEHFTHSHYWGSTVLAGGFLVPLLSQAISVPVPLLPIGF
jgi:hypothetical protein